MVSPNFSLLTRSFSINILEFFSSKKQNLGLGHVKKNVKYFTPKLFEISFPPDIPPWLTLMAKWVLIDPLLALLSHPYWDLMHFVC